ncbi:hypothetical protein KM043_002060 [Ampulex compressa]|nr:hypothetical protein KM043_002060 [Ampulex compressa]
MSQDPTVKTMKANVAATKIQANFRGYRVRKHLKDTNSETKQGHEQQPGRKKEADGTPKKQENNESIEEKSATKIQAGIRGFLVRKRQQAAQTAATRIQAGFRGFRTRKLLKQNGRCCTIKGGDPLVDPRLLTESGSFTSCMISLETYAV